MSLYYMLFCIFDKFVTYRGTGGESECECPANLTLHPFLKSVSARYSPLDTSANTKIVTIWSVVLSILYTITRVTAFEW